jgi:hypothetical protein
MFVLNKFKYYKMSEGKSNLELLEEINHSLQEIIRRQDLKESFSESDKLFDKINRRVENSTDQIQESFDRIHDKVFNFNNIMIAAYLVLGTFPSNSPILPLWTVLFPIIILGYLIFIDMRQMEIHRFASNEMNWTSEQRDEFGKKIHKQTWLSIYAMGLSLICLGYIILHLF